MGNAFIVNNVQSTYTYRLLKSLINAPTCTQLSEIQYQYLEVKLQLLVINFLVLQRITEINDLINDLICVPMSHYMSSVLPDMFLCGCLLFIAVLLDYLCKFCSVFPRIQQQQEINFVTFITDVLRHICYAGLLSEIAGQQVNNRVDMVNKYKMI